MPIIQVNIAEGRTLEQKTAAFAAITDAVIRTLDVRREQVRITINEVKLENYSIGGERMDVIVNRGSAAPRQDQ